VIGVDAGKPPEADALHHEGIEIWTGVDGLGELRRARAVVKSPGVPREAPLIVAARELGLPVLGELELGWRLLERPFVAVTGTNGKTTTAELLGAIWRAAEREVAVAGNVGTAVSSLTGLRSDATVVCEASSFQLEDAIAFAPEVAVLLNVTPDHLDRHKSFDAYRDAKRTIFAHQHGGDVAVLPAAMTALKTGAAHTVTFGGEGADLALRGGDLEWGGRKLLPAAEIALRGAHNVENAMAAAAAAMAYGIPASAIAAALRDFKGVEHRLEKVATIGGVTWVNDSKATNVASAIVALEAFDEPVHLILGGEAQGQSFDSLREPVASRATAVYLVGEAAGALADALKGAVALEECGDLASAIGRAHRAAKPGEVVLLSPACKSFDQFPGGFEERGTRFKELVAALTQA
jgi:UDP-N-acetylmuramoylalanine--D-glutamate ligase